jgi:site-specific recombinase XerD
MINRRNYLDTRQWLQYLRDVNQLSEKTCAKYRGSIRHLLEWADDTPFPKAHKIRPIYPVYLRDVPVVRNYKATGRTLSKSTQELMCMSARNFFTWARQHLRHYSTVDPRWIETLVPGRQPETVQERELYTLADVLAMTRPAPTDVLKQKRDKATVALMFLSGIRVGALVTLPIQAVDLPGLAIKQWPELGVATKNGKAATTYLLDIPELLDVVREWDKLVRAELPATAPWFTPLVYNYSGDEVVLDRLASIHERRRGVVAEGLKELCAAARIAYLSPHKLRHGHAVYALKRARTIGELKAVSQNLMHSDLTVTNGVYGVLTDSDVQHTIASLGQLALPEAEGDQDALVAMLETLLSQLKRGT